MTAYRQLQNKKQHIVGEKIVKVQITSKVVTSLPPHVMVLENCDSIGKYQHFAPLMYVAFKKEKFVVLG